VTGEAVYRVVLVVVGLMGSAVLVVAAGVLAEVAARAVVARVRPGRHVSRAWTEVEKGNLEDGPPIRLDSTRRRV